MEDNGKSPGQRRLRALLGGALTVAAALVAGSSAAQEAYPAEGDLPAQPEVVRPLTPLTPERLEQLVPKHPGYLGVLAPENIAKARPAPPWNLTGTWFIDLSRGFNDYMFGPPYPKFFAPGREALIEQPKAQARGETYRDAIGQCYPPGMPMLMTRVWPHNFIQLPTGIFVISGFNNSMRQIFMDGRDHSDPDLIVPSYNGESIGRWENGALVVHSKYFETDNHYIDLGVPISEEFELVERISLVDDGRVMQVEYIMTDPQMWEGEWRSTKRYNRQDHTDINEANCILQYNASLPGTNLGNQNARERGQSEVEGVSDED